jgi:hypothetical protein
MYDKSTPILCQLVSNNSLYGSLNLHNAVGCCKFNIQVKFLNLVIGSPGTQLSESRFYTTSAAMGNTFSLVGGTTVLNISPAL